jgi:hypothetical protein
MHQIPLAVATARVHVSTGMATAHNRIILWQCFNKLTSSSSQPRFRERLTSHWQQDDDPRAIRGLCFRRHCSYSQLLLNIRLSQTSLDNFTLYHQFF